VNKLPPPAGPPHWVHLIAFIAVLVTATVLIVFGHLTATGVTSVCAAIVGLYGAFRVTSRRE
jgi:hypothetical protein